MALLDSIGNLQHELYEGLIAGLADGRVFRATDIPPLLAAGCLFGLVHALMPGHGKAVLTCYHLGAGRRMARAAIDGVLVSLLQVGFAVVIVFLGWPLIRRGLQGEITAPLMERASAVLVLLIGVWLLVAALLSRGSRPAAPGHALAIAAGLVPCPVTAFLMIYATFTGSLAAGLTVIGGYAAGMAATIAAFPVLAVTMRGRLLPVTWISEHRQILQMLAGLAIISLGGWLLLLP